MHHYISPTGKFLHPLKKSPHLLHVNEGWIKTQTKRINPREASSSPKKRKYVKRRTTDDKLCDILNEIHCADWALSDFLYLVFQHKDADGKETKHNHGNAVLILSAQNSP